MKRAFLLLALAFAGSSSLWAQEITSEQPADNQDQQENYDALLAANQQSVDNLDATSTFKKKEDKKAQASDDSDKLFKQFSFIPMPVIASNPTSGFMFGLAPASSWLFGDQATTSRSSVVATILYTTKKQFLTYIKSNVFTKDDGWNLLGDWRYFATSQPTYGLGTGPSSSKLAYNDHPGKMPRYGVDINPVDGEAQLMNFNYVRFHETALKRIGDSRFFTGIGYHLDIHSKIDDKSLDLDDSDGSVTLTSRYAYDVLNKGFDADKTILSGVSLNALYDSRDNPINPTSGRYAYINFRMNPEFLGSSKGSSMLWVEYRDYFRLSKARPRHLLGIWTYGNFVTSGDVPYLDLPAIGWDQFGRSGRGFAQGRWRGEDLWYGEAEYRFPLQKHKETLGGVAYVNATTASSRTNNIGLFEYVEPAAGLGLRILLNKQSGANLVIDYAWGSRGSQGFYLNINEAF
ncbi:MAG: BamA/TamA family outer membrane protein [Mangrovibacterium sp.]